MPVTPRVFSALPLALVLLVATLAADPGLAFEDAKVLPKGVRNIDMRSVNTDFDQKTDNSGVRQPLAQPLQQELTFNQIAKDQDANKARQLQGFLLDNKFKGTDSVGHFTADMKGHIAVAAPIVSYGVTDQLTLGVGTPIYTAATSVSMGFAPNANATRFVASLADTNVNQKAQARDAADQFSHAVDRLNQKLVANHYAEIKDWHGQGIGDMTFAGKYRFMQLGAVAMASTTGVVAPTGRTKDPDVLNDVPFGNGVWAPFGELAVDEALPGDLVLNQYGKYTNSLPGQKVVRAVTADEKIAVDKVSTRYKIGDQFDAGMALRYEPSFGLVAGLGYTFSHKFGDIYRGAIDSATRDVMMAGSETKVQSSEMMLGYSTVPLYLAGRSPVPMDAKLSYARQVKSLNLPVTNLAQFDLNLYF